MPKTPDLRLSLLVVEDDIGLQNFYESLFDDPRVKETFQCDMVDSAEAALRKIARRFYDVVVLDWNLPKQSGMVVLDSIRTDPKSRLSLVFMVTSEASPAKQVEALETGADDYLIKPFDAEVLVARLMNLARRKTPAPPPEETLRSGNLELQVGAVSRLSVSGRPVRLFPKEAELLAIFLRRPNVIHTAEHLWDSAWGYPSVDFKNTLQATLSGLRSKLGERWGARIVTHRDRGYALEPG